MDFKTCYEESPFLLMEGAIGERLKREYHIKIDGPVALADLIYIEHARDAITNIYQEYIRIAEEYDLPFMATTTTRRANFERTTLAKYPESIIEDNVRFLKDIRKTATISMFIGGLMGCKGDAYKAADVLSRNDSYRFHSWQANLFKNAGADYLLAGIMPSLEEAIGMAWAMEATGLPYIISFMIRGNGMLIDGTSIHDAIATIDANVHQKPLCYMTNCVHPSVLERALKQEFNKTDLVVERFQGIQANTSSLSPEDLDCCKDLQCSDSLTLAKGMVSLFDYIHPKVLGGCCGTDASHIKEIAKQVKAHLSI